MNEETFESLHEEIESLKLERAQQWRDLLPENVNELPEEHDDVAAFLPLVRADAEREGEEIEDDEALRRARIQAAGRAARLAEMHPAVLDFDRRMAVLRARQIALGEG